jgi:hypothetical protein
VRVRASLLLLALAVSACGTITIPKPPAKPTPAPTPKPTPTPPACPELGVPWCHEAGMQCGACKHQPPGEACPILAPPCPVEPPVVPPVVPPALPLAQPLIADERLKALPLNMTPQQRWAEVRAAIAAYQELEPGDWRGDTLSAGPIAIDHAFERISAYLRPITAAQSITADGQRSDAIFVERPAVNMEEWHLFSYGTGHVASSANAFKGLYELAAPQAACTAPVPTFVKRLQLDVYVRPNRTVVDATIITGGLEYCTAIGMGEMGGLPRAACPVRNECPGFKCLERPACEALFPLVWSGVGHATDNPAQWEVPRGVGGTVTACAGGVCESVAVKP